MSSANCCVTGAPPTKTLTLSRTPACFRASMVFFMEGIVTVSSADRQTICAPLSRTVSMNFSGDTSAPRSMTSKPPPSTAKRPGSCRCRAGRLLTVPITTVPAGLAPARARPGLKIHGAFHGPGGEQQFGHEVLFFLETACPPRPWPVSSCRRSAAGVDLLVDRFLGDRDGRLGVAG